MIPNSDASSAVATRLGQYQITRLLGRGGMGCVYLAWDERLRRKVALKVLLPQHASDGESLARFLREGRAAAAVTHDHVVTVYDAGQDGETAYLAMQYLQGMTLHRYLETKGRLPVPAAVRIVREVAAGLAAAHAIGLLHRDIKPGNILLEAPKGRVKLLDFGLATAFIAGDAKLTQTGMIVGTPTYMSPEQARCWKMDHRSDLFSLGVVLYQMCAGQVPFTGPDTMAVLTALAVETPPPVSRVNPRVPRRLELLIDRLLDKSPDGRPQSASELVNELKGIERDWSTRPKSKVLDAEVVKISEQEGEEVAVEPDVPLAAEVDGPIPKPTPSAHQRSWAASRRTRRKRGVRHMPIYMAVIALGVIAAFGIMTHVVLGLIDRPRVGSADGDDRQERTAEGELAREARPRVARPWELPPGWPPGKPPPPVWRPGMPLPRHELLPPK